MNIYLPTGSVLLGVHFISGLLTPSGIIGLGEALGRRKKYRRNLWGVDCYNIGKRKEMM